jgi:hypothetical protein
MNPFGSSWNSARICGWFRIDAGLSEVGNLGVESESARTRPLHGLYVSGLLVIRPIVESTVAPL